MGFAVNCKKRFRRGRSIAQNPMSETKVTAHPYKSFGQACLLFEEKFERQRKQALPLSKACRVEGQRPRRSRRSETPPAQSNSESKINSKAKQNEKFKSAMQPKKVKPREVTKTTI